MLLLCVFKEKDLALSLFIFQPIAKLKRPVVEVNSSSKVPTNVRQRYLNAFIDECVKICQSEEEAYRRVKY